MGTNPRIDPMAIDQMKDLLPDYLVMKGINPDRAFKCLSPDHVDHRPSMRYSSKYKKIRCFSCGRSYDIFDLVGQDFSLNKWWDQVNKVADLFHIQLDINRGNVVAGNVPKATFSLPEEPEYKEYDILSQINNAHNNVGSTDYFINRGFSQNLISQYKLGYWPDGYNSFVDSISPDLKFNLTQEKHYTYMIPVMDPRGKPVNFISRMNSSGTVDEYNPKTLNMKGVKCHFLNEWYITNPELLKGSKTIFVVEGWADALSIEEAGGKAIALNASSNAMRFLRLCESNAESLKRLGITIVVSGDYDKAGKLMNHAIIYGNSKNKISGLNALGIKNMAYNVSGSFKDANEHLVKDRASFEKTIRCVRENRLRKSNNRNERCFDK